MVTSNQNLLSALQFEYRFTLIKSDKGQFHFTFHNTRGNTEPICWSEPYTTKQACIEAMNKVKAGAATASFEDRTQ